MAEDLVRIWFGVGLLAGLGFGLGIGIGFCGTAPNAVPRNHSRVRSATVTVAAIAIPPITIAVVAVTALTFVTTIVMALALASVVTMLFVPFAAMPLAVVRNIDILVPRVLNEVDRHATRIVATAIAAPMALMLRRHTQVDRCRCNALIRLLDNHRLRQHHLGWLGHIAEVDPPKETRLTKRH